MAHKCCEQLNIQYCILYKGMCTISARSLCILSKSFSKFAVAKSIVTPGRRILHDGVGSIGRERQGMTL